MDDLCHKLQTPTKGAFDQKKFRLKMSLMYRPRTGSISANNALEFVRG
jgi:hypothetical protein